MVRRAVPVALLVVFAAALLRAGARDTFTLGVLRRDGILIPFATFNGRSWGSPWPASDSGVVLPIALADVPRKWWGPAGPSAPWTAWMTADEAQRPLKIEKPAQVRVFCGGRVGLATDYHGPAVDPREPTMPKDALAIAAEPGNVPLQPIIEVSIHSPDAKRLIDAITADFNEQETIAARQFTNWQHPYPASERAGMPIELEAFYRSREKSAQHGEWLTSYIETVRRYPAAPEDQGCGLITYVRGWVLERPGKEPDIHLSAIVTYCDRENVLFMLPFGRLAIDGESYWVYQMSSWRDEVYTVSRVRPDEVRPLVAVLGGACPKGPARRR